jgi:O-antigen/teichoic acid export membrane protein
MAETTDMPRRRPLSRAGAFLSERRGLLTDYFAAISGAGGRLVFSLIYFVALANALSLADFGLFATASAAGVMLSRVLAFGFIAPLYRTATIRPRLIGTFTAGFAMMALLSLPLLAAASALTYWLFFAASLSPFIFAAVVIAEALLWRPVEAAIIVNNGLGLFGRGAVLTILGTVFRSALAAIFIFSPDH